MANFPIINNLRIVPRDSDYLDRKVGSRGEIYFDKDSKTLRIYTGSSEEVGGLPLARADLTNISDADFLQKATSAGVGGGGGGSAEFSFSADDSTIQTVAAGNSVKFLGGSGISTNSSADELTITNDANVFSTISVAGQSDVVADSLTDTLTLVAGANVTITTDDSTDTVTISASTGSGGIGELVEDTTPVLGGELNADSNKIVNLATPTADADAATKAYVDANASGGVDVADNYLPAITKLVVDNIGATAYTFDQYTGSNPTIYAINGTTIAFDLTEITGHPFEIQTPAGVAYNTGLVHVAPDGTVSTGANAQGKTSGVLYWKVPTDISGGYRYQCQSHAAMVGSLTIKDIAVI